MKSKLRLNLDSLHVETFDTAAPAGSGGTVHGRAVTFYTIDCSGCNTGSPPESGDSKCTECGDCTDTYYQTCMGDSCEPDSCQTCEVCDKSWRYTDCQASCLC